jgi:hypothetical protein
MRVSATIRGCLALGLLSGLVPRGAAAQDPYAPVVAVSPEGQSEHRGFMAMPFIGVHSFQGDNFKDASAGLRLGTLLGGFVNPNLSLNGEITLDFVNPDTQSGVDVTAVMVDLAFSPLFHAPAGAVEFVIGPKLGFFNYSVELTYEGETGKGSANGSLYGVNAGLLFPVGKFSMGGLLSFTGRHPTKVCTTEPGKSEQCGDASGDDYKVLGFTLAAMF